MDNTENLTLGSEVVAGLIRRCVDENSTSPLNQEEYLARYNALVERYEGVKSRVADLKKKRLRRLTKADAIGAFMFSLSERDQPLVHFDERLWLEVIDSATVNHDGSVTFKFNNGTEIKV